MILILHRHRLFSFSLLYKKVILGGMDKSLLDAIVNGDVSTVTNLLDHGYNVDCCDEEGTNLLHMSAANGDEKMARLLLSRGASLKATNHYGWTALMAAAYYGHQRICTMLIQNKADVNSQNFLGATALDCAARCGHYSVAEILVKAGAEINLQNRFCSGEGVEVSPLMTAAQHGHESVVQLLLRNGAEINYYNEKTRWNSLMLAALNGHTTTVEILVDHKADTNFTNILQKNALEIAENRQKKEVIEYLNQRTAFRRKSRGDQCLVKPTIIEAARNGDLESVKDLLDHNASDVLETDKDGATALVYAAMGNHLEVVQLLYEQGADLDVQDKKNGWTALMQATLYGHTKVAKFLIDHGADVNLRGSGGWTAFDVASITGDTEVLRLLASVTMQLPAKPKNNHSFLRWTNMKPNDIKMDREIISLPRDDMDRDFAKNKNWWAKMSNRFRNFNIMRSFRLSSSTKLTVIETSSKMSDAPEPDNVGTTRSLAKVLDTTLKATGREIKRPKTLTVGAPVCKLPDDLIDPILPPPSMSKLTFELTRSPRNTQIDDEEATTSQNSVSGELTRRIASNDRCSYSGSPDSSFSTASSPSNNSGSRTLRPTSPLTPDLSSAFMITKRRKSNSRGVSHSSGVHSDFYSSDIEKPTPKGRRHYKVAPEDTSNAADTMNFSACSLPSNINLDECKDDIGAILNSLCLEQYSSIFEEEEVDMEAFLELNGRDLKGLGVIDRDARHLLLAVIDKLNNGKYREQQRMQDLMATFKATSHR